ncbi:MAG: hypothetical protein HRT35_09005 [Algicola sp.]|nr:hypothetical protein [Algicola sp.]
MIGTWVGVKGWSVIAVPAPPSTTGFKLLVHNYTETLTFTAVDVPVENKGGAQTQFIRAVKYEQVIHAFNPVQPLPEDPDQEPELETSELIHVENGMLMLLDDIRPESGSDKPEFNIARSATIPHGDTALILGKDVVTFTRPSIPDICTTPSKSDQVGMPPDFLAQYQQEQKKQTIYDIVAKEDSLIFNVFNPNQNLQRDNNGLDVIKTTHIALDSDNEGGVINIPFIVKHANATRFTADFWLQTIKLPMSGDNFEQLQYSQTVDIEFHKKFNGEPGLITWPHVTINTLTKQ